MGWETDLSSQTSASQAGILHGDNDDIVDLDPEVPDGAFDFRVP